jgi:hypothetical protein
MAEPPIESTIATINDTAERWMQRHEQLLIHLKMCSDLPQDYRLDKKAQQAVAEYRRLLFRILKLYPPYS